MKSITLSLLLLLGLAGSCEAGECVSSFVVVQQPVVSQTVVAPGVVTQTVVTQPNFQPVVPVVQVPAAVFPVVAFQQPVFVRQKFAQVQREGLALTVARNIANGNGPILTSLRRLLR